ncbi:MAG: hypothetical protein GQ567_07200 [Methanosarcinales archaeon]|nr:hypothetical protein [Methanosarcinales archaeon]
MAKIPTLAVIAISAALILGAGCITDTDDNARSYNIVWAGTQPADQKAIEAELSHQIAAYPGALYGNVTVSASENDGGMRLHISATSPTCRYPDLYDFVYLNHELIMTGYLLEAIPEATRQDAIGIAMRNPEIAGAVSGGAGADVPTVRRILPETAEEFYAPKTCISVTWTDASVSALVDMGTGSVVETWGVGG